MYTRDVASLETFQVLEMSTPSSLLRFSQVPARISSLLFLHFSLRFCKKRPNSGQLNVCAQEFCTGCHFVQGLEQLCPDPDFSHEFSGDGAGILAQTDLPERRKENPLPRPPPQFLAKRERDVAKFVPRIYTTELSGCRPVVSQTSGPQVFLDKIPRSLHH